MNENEDIKNARIEDDVMVYKGHEGHGRNNTQKFSLEVKGTLLKIGEKIGFKFGVSPNMEGTQDFNYEFSNVIFNPESGKVEKVIFKIDEIKAVHKINVTFMEGTDFYEIGLCIIGALKKGFSKKEICDYIRSEGAFINFTQRKINDFNNLVGGDQKMKHGKIYDKLNETAKKVKEAIKAVKKSSTRSDLDNNREILKNALAENKKAYKDFQWASGLMQKYMEIAKFEKDFEGLKKLEEEEKKWLAQQESKEVEEVKVIEEIKPVEKVEVKKVKKVVKKEKSKVVEAVKESKVIEENKVEVVKDNEVEKIDESIMVDEIKDIEKMEAYKKIAGEAIMEKIRGEVWKEAEKPVESKKVDEIKVIEENKVDEVKKDENIVVDNNIDEAKMEAAEEEKMVIEKIKHLKALRAEIDESINDYEKRLEKIKGLKALKEMEKKQEERKVKLNKKDFEIKVIEKIKPVENKVEAVKADENIIEVKKDDEIKLIDLNKVDESNVEEVVKDLSRECDHQMYLFIKWSSRKSKCPVRLQRNKAKAEKAFEKNQFVNLKIRDLENKFGVKVDI